MFLKYTLIQFFLSSEQNYFYKAGWNWHDFVYSFLFFTSKHACFIQIFNSFQSKNTLFSFSARCKKKSSFQNVFIDILLVVLKLEKKSAEILRRFFFNQMLFF